VASPPTRMKPATGGEATGKHPLGFPGWLGVARVDRSVEEPGRPVWEAESSQREGEDITRKRPGTGVGEAHSSEEAG
jgi:hypothetical protein